MRYSDIVDYPRYWDKKTYPAVSHIEIPAEDLSEFEQLAADQTQLKVLGHDLTHNGVVIHVGCTSEDIQRRLESRWT